MNALAYYNERDSFAAGWLRNLIRAGHIAPGEVDERSIVNVRPDDLRPFTQCHFFAGIGGWSYALRLAGWPDDRPVWTGSCPCQPFSAAGAGKAADDERHLWPAWLPLIAERRPATVFGEQVEAAIGWGWLDAVFADLEGEGYACGATVLPACGVGAPHIRQRCWFVADAGSGGWREQQAEPASSHSGTRRHTHVCGGDGKLGDANGERPQGSAERGSSVSEGREVPERPIGFSGGLRSMADSERNGGRTDESQRGPQGRIADGRLDPWSGCDWLPCTDGKARPVRSRSFPLAHGVQCRTSKLRAYGNAIVPQVAAEFIGAFLDVERMSEAA